MKKITIITFLMALFCLTTQAQSVKLNAQIKTQRLFISKDKVNLAASDFATVAVAANCDYTATADSWMTVSKMKNGNAAIFAQPNYDLTPRQGTVTFTSADGTIKRTLTVTQDGGFGSSDTPISIAKATLNPSSEFQSGEGIDKSYDGDLNTMYHSPWSRGANFPITLTYELAEPSHVDYLKYIPRSNDNSDGNGNFQEVTISYQIEGSTTWVKVGDFNFGGSSSPSTVDFGENGIDNVKYVRVVVKSGKNNYASCVEMQFCKRESGGLSDILSSTFADALCTKLKDGVTREQIEQIPTREIREAALAMLDGTYSTEFRVGEFDPYINPNTLINHLKTNFTYSWYENATGIFFKPGDVAVIFVEGVGKYGIELQVRNFGPEVFSKATYALGNGMNIVKINHRGNGYIDYFIPDLKAWKNAPKVKIHFLNGVESGYFSPHLKGHTKKDWVRLLKNCQGDCFDMRGKYVNCVFPVKNIRAKCPNEGEQLMQQYDDVVRYEQELMGLPKYNYDFPNHQTVTTCEKSSGYMHANNDNCNVPLSAVNDALGYGSNFPTWAIAHELGHVNQTRGFVWRGLMEVTNNLLAAYVQHMFNPTGFHRLENESNRFRYYRYLENNVAKGATWLPSVEGDVFATLVPLYQIMVYTRLAGVCPDAYPDFFEKLRTKGAPDGSGPQQVDYVRQLCHITQIDFVDFFKKVGLLKPIDQWVADYGGAQLTITQSMITSLEKEIAKKGYEKAPEGLIYIDAWNYPIFRDKLPLEGNTIGKGCSKSGNNVRIQHAQWKNVVGFETYTADGKLLHATNYGRGEGGTDAQYTNCMWNTDEKPAYIMAVGYDGTRIKCYEPK